MSGKADISKQTAIQGGYGVFSLGDF